MKKLNEKKMLRYKIEKKINKKIYKEKNNNQDNENQI